MRLPSAYEPTLPSVDILAISTSPGDAESWCAGLLLQSAAQGLRCAVLDLTVEDPLPGGENPLLDAAERAVPLLGLTWRGNLHKPAGRLENNLLVRMTLAAEIRRLQPRVLLIPSRHAAQPDVAVASEMARQAAWFAGEQQADEEAAPHHVQRILEAVGPYERPTFYADVSAQREAALAVHALYSDKAAAARYAWHGLQHGCSAAEGFVSYEPLPLGKLL
jgi:LmbE family N-acetylglucosaminyl deacetylase